MFYLKMLLLSSEQVLVCCKGTIIECCNLITNYIVALYVLVAGNCVLQGLQAGLLLKLYLVRYTYTRNCVLQGLQAGLLLKLYLVRYTYTRNCVLQGLQAGLLLKLYHVR